VNDMTDHWAFSANTGFLWPELGFLERLERAASLGFSTVEFHDEAQREDPAIVRARLDANGLAVAGLNVAMGDTAGRAALAGEEAGAREDILRAIEVAEAVGAAAVHVLSGRTGESASGLPIGTSAASGRSSSDESAARARYAEALRFALERSSLVVLIEPLCSEAAPGYHVDSFDKAVSLIEEIAHPRLKIMFDCFHAGHIESDIGAAFERLAAHVGHVQIASFPARAEPSAGGIDYATLLPAMRRAGYTGAFGCEYRQQGSDAADRAWRESLPPPPAS